VSLSFFFALYNFSSRPHFEFTGQDGGDCQPSLANRCCLHNWGSHRQAWIFLSLRCDERVLFSVRIL